MQIVCPTRLVDLWNLCILLPTLSTVSGWNGGSCTKQNHVLGYARYLQ